MSRWGELKVIDELFLLSLLELQEAGGDAGRFTLPQIRNKMKQNSGSSVSYGDLMGASDRLLKGYRLISRHPGIDSHRAVYSLSVSGMFNAQALKKRRANDRKSVR